MLDHKVGDLHFLSYKNFEPVRNVINIVTTRQGGRSSNQYASLNLALHVGEDPDVTLENRALVAMGLGFEPENFTIAQQVHGAEVAVVSTEARGSGAIDEDDEVPGVDALVTNAPDVPLMVLVADCVALSMYDPNKRVIAVAHAGWKGTLGRIAEKTVARMKEAFGSDPSDLMAGISPAICPGEYDVGQEVYEAFTKEFGRKEALKFAQEDMNGTCYLDLWSANIDQLESCGVKSENIANAEICTALHPDRFYSHRGEKGDTGRFAALIMIKGTGDRSY